MVPTIRIKRAKLKAQLAHCSQKIPHFTSFDNY